EQLVSSLLVAFRLLHGLHRGDRPCGKVLQELRELFVIPIVERRPSHPYASERLVEDARARLHALRPAEREDRRLHELRRVELSLPLDHAELPRPLPQVILREETLKRAEKRRQLR